jgi:GNAT superfamily N-acetyltransferase
MIKLKRLITENFDAVSGEELDVEQYNQVDQMVKDSGINILSDKDLSIVYLIEGNVVAGLWVSYLGGKFSFDVIVSKNFRNRGYGARLIKQGLNMYREMASDDPDLKLELDVVNSRLIEPLKSSGLKVLQVVGGHTIMGYDKR